MPPEPRDVERLLKEPVTVEAEQGIAIGLWGDTTVVVQTDGSRLTMDTHQGNIWRSDIGIRVEIPETAPVPRGPEQRRWEAGRRKAACFLAVLRNKTSRN